MSFRHAILGLLANGPLHGYELKSAYERDLFPTSTLNIGQIYTTLERLSRDGFVEFEEINQSDRPDKKVYRLTTSGQRELKAWMARTSVHVGDQRSEVFSRMMLARRLKGYEPFDCLHREREACFESLQSLTQSRTKAENTGASFQTLLLLDLARFQLEALLKWFDHCEEVLLDER